MLQVFHEPLLHCSERIHSCISVSSFMSLINWWCVINSMLTWLKYNISKQSTKETVPQNNRCANQLPNYSKYQNKFLTKFIQSCIVKIFLKCKVHISFRKFHTNLTLCNIHCQSMCRLCMKTRIKELFLAYFSRNIASIAVKKNERSVGKFQCLPSISLHYV